VKTFCLLLAFSAAQELSAPEQVLLDAIADSGRSMQVGTSLDERVAPPVAIAPGPPPLLSFRYYEGKVHHRFGNTELMLDDAGH
jgi:hypothetical protein